MSYDVITVHPRGDGEKSITSQHLNQSLFWSSVSVPLPCVSAGSSQFGEIRVPPPVYNPENSTVKEYRPYYTPHPSPSNSQDEKMEDCEEITNTQ